MREPQARTRLDFSVGLQSEALEAVILLDDSPRLFCGQTTLHPFIHISVQPLGDSLLRKSEIYDFSECHNFGALRADSLAPGARRSPQNACSDNPATQGLSEHAD